MQFIELYNKKKAKACSSKANSERFVAARQRGFYLTVTYHLWLIRGTRFLCNLQNKLICATGSEQVADLRCRGPTQVTTALARHEFHARHCVSRGAEALRQPRPRISLRCIFPGLPDMRIL